MQCKDIPDRPILEFLDAREGRWSFAFDKKNCEDSVFHAMPEGTPFRLGCAKMGMLIRRGLVSGCGCGCRGDFEITSKGQQALCR